MNKEIEKKPKFVITAAMIMTVMLLAASAISMMTTENAFARKYENNQAASTSNSCLNPLFDSSTFDIAADIGNCGNTVSQQEGGGEASSPITLQIANPTIEVQAPPPPSPPEPQTCEECFTAFLTAEQIAEFEEAISIPNPELSTIEEVCAFLESNPPVNLPDNLNAVAFFLQESGIDQPTIDEIIDCLERVLGL